MAITYQPFIEKIVDHTQPFYYEDPVVMTRFDDTWQSANTDLVHILDGASWAIFITLFLCLIVLIVLLDQDFLVKRQSVYKRISRVTFNLIGTILQMGKLKSLKLPGLINSFALF